jgi:molybdenum cofactor cytidylyltransferase
LIPVAVLAAGKSTRMGRPKATLRLDDADTFLTRIIRTFQQAQVDDVVVVLGHEAQAILKSVEQSGLSPRFVVNEQFESGQLSSVLAGLRAIDRPGVNAMLMTLVDVPLVSAATVRAVLDRYRTTRAPVVRPVRGALHGHPVLIDRSLFDKLRAADPQRGAKPIIRAHVSAAGDVEVEDEGAFFDVDTPEDYRRVVEPGTKPGDSGNNSGDRG